MLRDLARDSVPLALIQPACSGIFAAELDMIQRDTNAPMIPLHPESLDPAIDFMEKCCETFEQSSSEVGSAELPIGKIEQIVMERQAQDRSDEQVKRLLARDSLLLRRLIGSFQKVGALQSEKGQSLGNMSVHLMGTLPVLTRWSVGPVIDEAGASISLVGERGKVSLHLPEGGRSYLTTTCEDQSFLPSLEEFEPDEAMATLIEKTLDNENVLPKWEDGYRAIDLADTAAESIRRGKTLPVSNARLTEEDTFKSLMAAGGCLIVLVLPFLFLLVSLVDGLQIPVTKRLRERINAGERSVRLPADLNGLQRVTLVSSDQSLRSLTRSELYSEFTIHEKGTPQAYAANRNEITLAPIPEETTELELQYEGNFNMGQSWMYVLLLPIVIFLGLQLFKLVFPKEPSS